MSDGYEPVDPAVRRAHLAQGAGLPHGAKLDEVADEVAGEALAARYARKTVITGEVVAGPRKGKGICSGWADEEDYGPRYEEG